MKMARGFDPLGEFGRDYIGGGGGRVKSSAAGTDSGTDAVTLAAADGGSIQLGVEVVAVGSARAEIAGLIKESGESGTAYLIRNAKSPGAPATLLINVEVLQARLRELTKPARTGAQILESLPFKRRGSPRLRADLQSDVAPVLTVRARSGSVVVPEAPAVDAGPIAQAKAPTRRRGAA